MKNHSLHNAECLEWMRQQPAGAFDAIIADPPYMTTNLHFDKAPALDWAAWWAQAWRVVKPSGVVVLFAADLFTVDLIQSQRANYRYRLVWEKTRATGFYDSNRRPLRSHEDVLVFAQKPGAWTYNPQKTPRIGPDKSVLNKAANRSSHHGGAAPADYVDDGTRYPTSVVRFSSIETNQCLHPTQKPLDLMRWLVRTYTNPGETVLDCFAGSGSTLAACLLEGRSGMGCEMDAQYFAKAQARLQAIENTPQLAFDHA